MTIPTWKFPVTSWTMVINIENTFRVWQASYTFGAQYRKDEDSWVSSVPSDKKEGDDSNYGDLDVYEPQVFYDENDGIYAQAMIFVNKRMVRLMGVIVEQWLDLMYGDHKKVDIKTRGDDEVDLTNEEFSDLDDKSLIDKNKVIKIFRIDTNIFNFETPICKAFNELNYLLKINTNLFTYDILGVKTYEKYEEERAHELNNDQEESWSENGAPNELVDHLCKKFRFKNGKTKWPTYGKLKEEVLKQNAIYEGSWGNATRGVMNFCAWLKRCFRNFHELDYELLVKIEEYWWKVNNHGVFNNHTGRNDEEMKPNDDHGIGNLVSVWDNTHYHEEEEFEMIKYPFGPGEEYVAVKEHEYDDLTRVYEDACCTY
ncbi:hypothetical protein Tco_0991164 [Tanacetum coccineum]|uniref:Uncharacterized protein n=1 Tax=Tanacetum coccineum TaxID=301880 RepID=A0ABQ5EYR5_9ASTR